ncbi:hypothetical protein [Dietzia sp. 179-F 9C3 NHS]|uniref:hypothetical protein n=1 Tax=Dietzia sp. 179-F 9C3 NHS TaxID=3374295 RepID=UPI0038794111
MLLPRPRPVRGGHVARPPRGRAARLAPLAATALLLGLGACASAGEGSGDDAGPTRLTPQPLPDVAAAMIADRPPESERRAACELLDLPTDRVIELTGADMPDVEPVGDGDLADICTYGGPGSPERLAATQAEAIANGLAAAGAPTTWPAPTPGPAGLGGTDATTTAPDDPEAPARVPDTVAAGVIRPAGGAAPALADQAAMLGARYACSEVRGSAAPPVEGAPPAAERAPAPAQPELGTAYIDCVATPAGGGVEVHTILVADGDLWHVAMVRPEVPRTPVSEARALEATHRLALEILG